MADHKKFISEIDKKAEQLVKEAEIITDTRVVNFKPIWTKEITEESLGKHIDYVNMFGAAVTKALSDIAHDNYDETKIESWTGVLDLGPMSVNNNYNLREKYSEEVGDEYGTNYLIYDYKQSEEVNAYFKQFTDKDHERCKAYFVEEKEDTTTV